MRGVEWIPSAFLFNFIFPLPVAGTFHHLDDVLGYSLLLHVPVLIMAMV